MTRVRVYVREKLHRRKYRLEVNKYHRNTRKCGERLAKRVRILRNLHTADSRQKVRGFR